MNNVNLIGNIARDHRFFPAEGERGAMVTFPLAVNDNFTDRNGARVERAHFIDLVAHGRRAETLARYTAKGHKLSITGRLEQRQWTDPDGTKHYAHQVVVIDFDFLTSKEQAAAMAQRQPEPAPEPSPQAQMSYSVDDVPFDLPHAMGQ